GRKEPPGRHDIANTLECECEGQRRDTSGEALHAIADPESVLRRKELEYQRAAHQREQATNCEQDAAQAVAAQRKTMRHDEGDSAEAEKQSDGLAPGHALTEQEDGEDGDENWI